MDVESGRLYMAEDVDMAQLIDELRALDQEVVPVKEEDITLKQKERMQVSPHDNRSKLGMLRIAESRRGKKRKMREHNGR